MTLYIEKSPGYKLLAATDQHWSTDWFTIVYDNIDEIHHSEVVNALRFNYAIPKLKYKGILNNKK